jgi:putative tryptophan/tyrosine transport system substrate-binding protein
MAEAYQVLQLISSHDKGYAQAVNGFEHSRDFSARILFLSDYAEIDLARAIREDRPEAIVAVGDKALAAVRRIKNVPIVSLMSLSFHRISGTSPNLTGVEFTIRPDRYLALFDAMKLTRVGILYDPEKSGGYLKKAQQSAARNGIELLPKVVTSPKDVVGQLTRLQGEVDAIWLIPDATAVSYSSAEAYFLHSLRHKVPIISFNRSHLQLGAAVVIDADEGDMGRQAAEMTAAILNGTPVSALPPVTPRKVELRVNQGVLKHLHIPAENLMRLPNFTKE